ncbi:MAG: cellulose-binding protein, partial [Cellvibrionaceae bacterium]|nr:cellulose-binding protein [Cellvibrionaceae bacterium]
MQRSKLFISSAVLALLSACGSTKHQTLGSLQYEKKEEKAIEYKKMDHKEVRAEYQELLNLFEDKQLKEQIERRIADVYMMEGVQKQNTQTKQTKSYYLEAIKSYREILDKYP